MPLTPSSRRVMDAAVKHAALTTARVLAIVKQAVAKRRDVAVAKRGAQVEVTLPPKTKVPAALAARVAKLGVLRFKTITVDERDALARLR